MNPQHKRAIELAQTAELFPEGAGCGGWECVLVSFTSSNGQVVTTLALRIGVSDLLDVFPTLKVHGSMLHVDPFHRMNPAEVLKRMGFYVEDSILWFQFDVLDEEGDITTTKTDEVIKWWPVFPDYFDYMEAIIQVGLRAFPFDHLTEAQQKEICAWEFKDMTPEQRAPWLAAWQAGFDGEGEPNEN